MARSKFQPIAKGYEIDSAVKHLARGQAGLSSDTTGQSLYKAFVDQASQGNVLLHDQVGDKPATKRKRQLGQAAQKEKAKGYPLQ